MARPTLLPRHAETAGGTPDANITEPSSGEKDTGFVSGTAASSAKTNWILWIVYLWIKYFSETKSITVNAASGSVISGTWNLVSTGYSAICTSAGGTLVTRASLPKGATVTGVEINFVGDNGGTGDVQFVASTVSQVASGGAFTGVTTIGDDSLSNPANTWQVYSLTMDSTPTLDDGDLVFVSIITSGITTSMQFTNITIYYTP